MNIGLRIGLDIDDCLADFWGAYCEYFDTKNNPRMLEDSIITKTNSKGVRLLDQFFKFKILLTAVRRAQLPQRCPKT